MPVVLFIWASFPGRYAIDSLNQLNQGLSGHFGDWHPPIMSWLWAALVEMTGKLESFYIAQIIIVVIALSTWFFVFINLTNTPGWVLWGLGLFSPIYLMYSGAIIKDSGMAFSLLAASGIAVLVRFKPQLKLSYTLAIFLLFYAANARQNSLPAVLPILLYICLDVFSGKFKILFSIITTLFLGLFFQVGGKHVKYEFLKSEKNTVEQVLMLHDLTFFVLNDSDDSRIPDDFKSEFYSIAKLRSIWTPASVCSLYLINDTPEPPLRLNSDKKSLETIKNSWLKSILDNPFLYIQHRSFVYAELLDSQCTYQLIPLEYDLIVLNQWSEVEKKYSLNLSSRLPGSKCVEHILARMLRGFSNLTPFVNGWFCLFGLLIIAGLSLKSIKGNNLSAASLIFSLSGLLYILPYLFISPHSEWRYLYWSFVASIFSSCCLFAEKKPKKALASQHQSH